MDFDVVKSLLAALERERVHYAIFGAVAMGLHGLARFTEDLDIFVEPEAANIARLRTALRSVVDDPEIEHITAPISWATIPRCNTYRPMARFTSTS